MKRRQLPVSSWKNPDVLCNRLPDSTSNKYTIEEIGKGACSACCMKGTSVVVTYDQRLAYQAAGTDVRILATNSPLDEWSDILPYQTGLRDYEQLQLDKIRQSLKSGESVVIFIGKCGLLDTVNKRCTVMGDPIRSRSCGELEPGSYTCMQARSKAGYVDHTFDNGRIIIPISVPE